MKLSLVIGVVVAIATGCATSSPTTSPSPVPIDSGSPAGSPSPTAAVVPATAAAPAPTASVGAPTASPSSPTTSGGMWPQSNLDEVQAAQELADAGDPDYTWQVDPLLVAPPDGELGEHLHDQGTQIAERFLRDELRWDAFLFNVYPTNGFQDDGGADGVIRGLVYSRCAPGEANPLYPYEQEYRGADKCAPTIDDLHYETVSIDLSQPARRGPHGIWVVNGWRMRAPFAQADTGVIQAAVEARLEAFLRARIDGTGAETYAEVPLLYATTTGARYERFEFELLGAQWPVGDLSYVVRLFADEGATVVEQPIEANLTDLQHEARLTTENGRPVPVRYAFLDGEVTWLAPLPWTWSVLAVHGLRGHTRLTNERGGGLSFVDDPLTSAVGSACDAGQSVANTSALADAIGSDPDLVATDPVPVTIAGQDGLRVDVTAAPGATICADEFGTRVLTWVHRPAYDDVVGGLQLGEGVRMRLYLLDAPKKSSIGILAIAILADDTRFDEVLAAATPIVESVEFHVPSPSLTPSRGPALLARGEFDDECKQTSEEGLLLIGGLITESTNGTAPVDTWAAIAIKPGSPVHAKIWSGRDGQRPIAHAPSCMAALDEELAFERDGWGFGLHLEPVDGFLELGPLAQ